MVAWGNLAEICKQYLAKGQQVYVEGRLQTRRWEDAEGKKHAAIEIVASEMIMLGERREPAAQGASAASEEEALLLDLPAGAEPGRRELRRRLSVSFGLTPPARAGRARRMNVDQTR